MKPDNGEAAIPDLLLERYRLDEVSLAERAEVERRLRHDEQLRGRLREIERSDEEIRDNGFAKSLAAHLQSRVALEAGGGHHRAPTESPDSGRRWLWALPAVVGAAALLLVVVVSRGLQPDSTGDRVKGLRPSLTVFRQTRDGSEVLADGAAARQGDVVRLGYQAAGRPYGVILSIDGRGMVTVHLPPAGSQAVALQRGDKVLLDHAYELDDAPRWECFYFVTSQQAFDARPVVEAAKREAAVHRATPSPLALPRGLEQSMVFLHKEQNP